jgi:anthranilate phosphoribosyltransferase
MKKYLEEVLNHEYLSREETHDILINITQEKYPSEQLASLMSMLQLRGITVDELLASATASSRPAWQ